MKPDYKLVAKAKYIHANADLASEIWHEVYKRYYPAKQLDTLVETLQSRIVSGAYPPGAKIDSVRDLAAEAAVNPNTMQRALAELEQSGLLRAERTAGRFVTEDKELIAAVRRQLARDRVEAFVQSMAVLGYHRSELPVLLQESGAQAQ